MNDEINLPPSFGNDEINHRMQENGWIRTSDRLPATEDDLLLWFAEVHRMDIGYYVAENYSWHWWMGEETVEADCPPTHWMPLPESPK